MYVIKLLLLLLIIVECYGYQRLAVPRNRSRRVTPWRQRITNAMRNRHRNAIRVCYDLVGCFDLPHPRSPLQKIPEDPNTLDTRFYLFRRNIKFSQPEILLYNNNGTLIHSKFNFSQPLKVIIHGYMGKWNREGALNASYAYLKIYDCNVVIMDWSTAARGPQYALAAANTELVGRQLGLLLHEMIKNGLNSKEIHLIGFSLGAHVAACSSELLKAKNYLIGRITGLDASSPLFRHNHVREKSKKLDKEDAAFVDVLHTDASPVFVDGFGLWEPIGHVDFFANGGQEQPGCFDRHPSVVVTHFDGALTRDTACSHIRAFELFFETIVNKANNTNKCEFLAYACPGGLPSFQKGQCFPRLDRPENPITLDLKYRSEIGVQGEDARGSGVMYFVTQGTWPYCGTQLQASVSFSHDTPSTYGVLALQLQYNDETVKFEFHCELIDSVARSLEVNSLAAAKYNTLAPDLKKMQAVLKYYRYDTQNGQNMTEVFSNTVAVRGINIRDMYDNSWQYYGDSVVVDDDKEGNKIVAVQLKKKK